MEKCRTVSISYNAETPYESLVWIHQVICKILIQELELNPQEAGSFLRFTRGFAELIHKNYRQEEKNE